MYDDEIGRALSGEIIGGEHGDVIAMPGKLPFAFAPSLVCQHRYRLPWTFRGLMVRALWRGVHLTFTYNCLPRFSTCICNLLDAPPFGSVHETPSDMMAFSGCAPNIGTVVDASCN